MLKKITRTLAAMALGALILSVGVAVARDAGKPTSTFLGTVATGDLSASRTATLTQAQMEGVSWLTFFVDVTGADVTDITVTCTNSDDDGTTDFNIKTCQTVDGACTLYPASDAGVSASYDPADSENFSFRLKVNAWGHTECVFSDTGGDGSDSIVVTAKTSAH